MTHLNISDVKSWQFGHGKNQKNRCFEQLPAATKWPNLETHPLELPGLCPSTTGSSCRMPWGQNSQWWYPHSGVEFKAYALSKVRVCSGKEIPKKFEHICGNWGNLSFFSWRAGGMCWVHMDVHSCKDCSHCSSTAVTHVTFGLIVVHTHANLYIHHVHSCLHIWSKILLTYMCIFKNNTRNATVYFLKAIFEKWRFSVFHATLSNHAKKKMQLLPKWSTCRAQVTCSKSI